MPGPAYRAHTFSQMSSVLNAHLSRLGGEFRPCSDFDISTLYSLQRTLARLADPTLLSTYPVNDGRSPARMPSNDIASNTVLDLNSDENTIFRDGLCHSVVLALVHHLSTQAREIVISSQTALPLLPLTRHRQAREVPANSRVFLDYEQRVSCQQCHTGTIKAAEWRNATLPPPLPVDKKQPGRERLRSCDYQNVPKCGPCEGLGGRRWGDGSDAFMSIECTPLAWPRDVPNAERVVGRYPAKGSARISGDTRSPVAVRPDVPGNYSALNATLYLDWTVANGSSGVSRQRYDFSDAAQLYLQSAAQRRAMKSGAMVTIVPTRALCVCEAAIAGNMHVESFVEHEALDPLDLAASQGGLTYLGRVNVSLDGADTRSAIADHWLKWAFHFLVDADLQSSTHGLPLRLYGPLGVRQVFSHWTTEDPTLTNPGLWTIPKGCLVKADECNEFVDRA
eukprot:CAMPEP_0119317810 /NCGR_PEP_ID=MMETSP1333-20130426/44434_1 /TAXON_ID=418940 /ORGANISM="Scyphosphaera apsteinii, Strain RCC1455" /LENGTH=450 /DNA_ID=CAMNT_0007323863 /DNA_START=76 /DNA_END=1428 /DNA_ORIENTATION=+